MDEATIAHLNRINATFYATIAHDFDETRGTAWAGWERLLAHIPAPTTPMRILDIGCGNGRFGIFLNEKWGDKLVYHGIDNNPALLASAQTALTQHGIAHQLDLHDVVMHPLIASDTVYDLVVAFGVIHHIPSLAHRQKILKNWAGMLCDGGYMAFACWRFYEFERFRARIVAWDDTLADKVEAGDYLLDWRRGKTAVRYCHYVDDAEHQRLAHATGLDEIITYRADGFTQSVNQYSLLKKGTPVLGS